MKRIPSRLELMIIKISNNAKTAFFHQLFQSALSTVLHHWIIVTAANSILLGTRGAWFVRCIACSLCILQLHPSIHLWPYVNFAFTAQHSTVHRIRKTIAMWENIVIDSVSPILTAMRYGFKPREKETMEKDTNDWMKEYGVRVIPAECSERDV